MTTYTLAEMSAEMAVRLGRGGQSNAVSVNNPLQGILFSFLESAQVELNDTYDFEFLKAVWEVPLLSGGNSIAWSNAGFTLSAEPHPHTGTMDYIVDHNRITGVYAEEADIWRELEEGIEYDNDSYQDTTSYPSLYDRRRTLEIWPDADKDYTLRVEGYAKLPDFSAATDVVTLDRQLVFLYALAQAKAHYGQRDANLVADVFKKRLKAVMGYTHGNRRYIPCAVPTPVKTKPRLI